MKNPIIEKIKEMQLVMLDDLKNPDIDDELRIEIQCYLLALARCLRDIHKSQVREKIIIE